MEAKIYRRFAGLNFILSGIAYFGYELVRLAYWYAKYDMKTPHGNFWLSLYRLPIAVALVCFGLAYMLRSLLFTAVAGSACGLMFLQRGISWVVSDSEWIGKYTFSAVYIFIGVWFFIFLLERLSKVRFRTLLIISCVTFALAVFHIATSLLSVEFFISLLDSIVSSSFYPLLLFAGYCSLRERYFSTDGSEPEILLTQMNRNDNLIHAEWTSASEEDQTWMSENSEKTDTDDVSVDE